MRLLEYFAPFIPDVLCSCCSLCLCQVWDCRRMSQEPHLWQQGVLLQNWSQPSWVNKHYYKEFITASDVYDAP